MIIRSIKYLSISDYFFSKYPEILRYSKKRKFYLKTMQEYKYCKSLCGQEGNNKLIESIKDFDIIFLLHLNDIYYFCKTFLPKIKNKIIIICEGSDDNFTDRKFLRGCFGFDEEEQDKMISLDDLKLNRNFCDNNKYNNFKKVYRIFVRNCDVIRYKTKIRSLPIGLPSITFGIGYFNDTDSYFEKSTIKRDKLVCMSFRLRGGGKHGVPKWHRYEYYNYFVLKSFVTNEYCRFDSFISTNDNKQIYSEYIESLKQHKFVLCPFGHGFDTFRTWEALYSGCIPIIPYTRALKYYADLPVYIIHKKEEVTEQSLNEKYIEIQENLKKGVYNLDKLSIEHWKRKILSHKK
jgi:hypothetical protein